MKPLYRKPNLLSKELSFQVLREQRYKYLDNLAAEYENSNTKNARTFISDLARVLEASTKKTDSQYSTNNSINSISGADLLKGVKKRLNDRKARLTAIQASRAEAAKIAEQEAQRVAEEAKKAEDAAKAAEASKTEEVNAAEESANTEEQTPDAVSSDAGNGAVEQTTETARTDKQGNPLNEMAL